MEIGLSLGSNLGDRLAFLKEAKRCVLELPYTELTAQSPVYETEPVGVKPEHQHLRFLNCVLIVESATVVHEFFDQLRGIEDAMGRRRTLDRYSPRPIDIDVVYADDLRIESGGLVIPHPRWAERAFVVGPLADVRPDLVVPGSAKTVREIWETLESKDEVRLFSLDWYSVIR
ncbi:MAG: 2-amino-4-hydroxy-6-hydroxymethyldihydropteridine diphosphokinase [Kiritimatiellae bacterium]|nr:2-amino-4-hydroxy-6-hydroxymethyldihydropteridine diphosphokinase [Kiritimatiellia bacterium]